MKKDLAAGHTKAIAYGVFHVKGSNVDIRTPCISGDIKPWIDAAKNARERFIGYLEKERIPHKVLLSLFND